MTVDSRALRRTALILVVAGLAWNLVEAAVALWAGLHAGSVAILAFGLDSIIELLAGGVLVWRLTADKDGEDAEASERRAQRLIGLTFLLLAAYVVLHSGANLSGLLPQPEPSLVGRRNRGCKRRRNGWPLRGQDAHRHAYAVKIAESGSHGDPVLRCPGPDNPGGDRPQQPVLMVVGRPGVLRYSWSTSSSRRAGRTSLSTVTSAKRMSRGSVFAAAASTACGHAIPCAAGTDPRTWR